MPAISDLPWPTARRDRPGLSPPKSSPARRSDRRATAARRRARRATVRNRRLALAVAVVVFGYAMGPILLSRYLSDLPPTGVVAASLSIVVLVRRSLVS